MIVPPFTSASVLGVTWKTKRGQSFDKKVSTTAQTTVTSKQYSFLFSTRKFRMRKSTVAPKLSALARKTYSMPCNQLTKSFRSLCSKLRFLSKIHEAYLTPELIKNATVVKSSKNVSMPRRIPASHVPLVKRFRCCNWCQILGHRHYHAALSVLPLAGHGVLSSTTILGYWLCNNEK